MEPETRDAHWYFCSRPIARATDTHMTPSRPQTLSASIRGWPSHISNSMLFPPKVVLQAKASSALPVHYKGKYARRQRKFLGAGRFKHVFLWIFGKRIRSKCLKAGYMGNYLINVCL